MEVIAFSVVIVIVVVVFAVWWTIFDRWHSQKAMNWANAEATMILSQGRPTAHKFSENWVRDCKHWRGKVLTGKHSHWCPDWDYLPIDETTDEFDCCSCGYDKKEPLK